jgi:hypothetical protein
VLEVLEGYQHREAPLVAAVEELEGYQHWEAPLAVVISSRSPMPLSIHIGASSVYNQLHSSGEMPQTSINVSC